MRFFFSCLVAALSLVSRGAGHQGHRAGDKSHGPGRPNVVVIISDDQDLQLDSMAYMPHVRNLIGDQGTFYWKHFCTIAVCCPSRVSLLTGKLAHNTNVTDVFPPVGGYPKFITEGLNDKYLPVWLQEAGYNTYYTGKLMNSHSITYWNSPFPAGWNSTAFLVDPGTYNYWNASFQVDATPPVYYPGEYNTDLVAQHALDLLDRAAAARAKAPDAPFFPGIAPIAPHTQASFFPSITFVPPQPATRHAHLFPDAKIPRSANFNPSKASGASWVSQLPLLNDSEIEYLDAFYRARLQSLQAVNELVASVVARLEAHGLMDNTYVIYTTDNGFHMGNHRLQPGKTCPYAEDVNIPFYLRGPRGPQGRVVDFVTTHTDLAPTFFQLAGIPLRSDFDGAPMPITADDMAQAAAARVYDHTAVEFWGLGAGEGKDASTGVNGSFTVYPNNTYKSMRVLTDTYNLQYTVWCTNEHELFDMKADPAQMNNLLAGAGSSSSQAMVTGISRPLAQLLARLDALLMVLKSCKGKACTLPWHILHPEGNVANLLDAMHAQYDSFYATQPKVGFTSCELGYFPAAEGPMIPN